MQKRDTRDTKIRGRTFMRYLLSYTLILLIPSLALTLIMAKYFIADFKEELIAENTAAVENAKTIADREFRQLYNLLSLFEYNESYHPQKTTGSDFDRIQFNRQLAQLMASEDLIAQVIYYPEGSDTVFSSMGMYKLEEIPRTALKHESWAAEDFIDTLQNAKVPFWRPAEAVTTHDAAPVRYLVRVEPIPYMSTQPYATLLFYISEARFAQVLKNTGSLAEDTILYFISADEPIAAFGAAPAAPGGEGTWHEQIPEEIKLEGIQYLVAVIPSDIMNITYVRLIDASVVYSRVWQRILLVSELIFAIIIVGGVIIYLSMYMNYWPLRRLKAILHDNAGMDEMPDRDIVKTAQTAIITLSQSRRELGQRLTQSLYFARHHMLLRLVRGDFQSMDEFGREGAQMEMELLDYFAVAVVQLNRPGADGRLLQQAIAKAEILAPVNTRMMGTFGTNEQSALFILTAIDSAAAEAFPVERLRLALKESCQCGCTVGLSNLYQDIGLVRASFLEAKTALEYRSIQGAERVIRFGETRLEAPLEFLRQYPKADLDLLADTVYSRNLGAVTVVLNRLAEQLRQMQVPLFQVKYLSFAIIDRITGAFSQLQEEVGSCLELEDIISLMEEDTLDELMAHLLALCGQLAAVPSPEPGGESFAERVYEYIRENGQACGYYVTAIADGMGMSVSNLSHRFKKSSGHSLSGCLAQMLIERSKELLQSGDLSVNEIAARMGYTNVSSYIKAFKLAVGFTPGEYRRLYGHGNNIKPRGRGM